MSSNTLGSTPFFTPTQLSGCALWLDANDPNGNGIVSTPGSVLSRWVDKSGSGNTVNANGSPVFSNYQSRNAVYINSNWFSRSASFAIANTTIFFVFSISNPIGDKSYFQVGANPNNGGGDTTTFFSDANVTRPGGTPTGRIYFGSGGSTLLSTQFPTATATDVIPYCIQTARITSSPFVENFTNGSLQNSRTGTVTRVSHNNLIVGSSNGGWQWTGYMSEIIMYTNALQDSQRQQVEGYLAWKWGLQANLPAMHLYKNSPFNVYVPRSILLPQTLAPSAAPFTFLNPLSISGLRYWYDASDPTVVQSSGTTLTSIQNKGILSQFSLTSNLGTAVTGMNTVNGLNVVRLASGTRLVYTGNYTIANPRTHIIVSRPLVNTSSSNVGFLWQNVGFNADDYFALESGKITEVSQGIVVVFQSVSVGANLSNETSIFGARCVSVASNIASFNGSQLSLTTSGTPAYTNPAGGSPFYVNANTNSAQDLCEFMSWNRALTNQEFQQAEGYLAWKWGLQSKLPSSHPFKNAPPGLPVPSVPPLRQLTGGVFSPTQITGCALWLDAADSRTITGASPVTAWTDKSSNAFSFSNFTGTTTLSNNARGTLSAMSFSGSSSLNNSTFTFPNITNSIFVVAFQTAFNSGNFSRLLNGGGGNADGFLFLGTFSNSGNYTTFTGNGTAWNPVAANTPTSSITGLWSLLEMTVTSSVLTPYLNGTAQNTKTGTTGAFTGLNIGGSAGGSIAQGWNGMCGEVIVFNSVLTTTQRQQVEGYLAWKWGLVGNLPNNHPYKKWPPPS